jgi:hypothetical protein
MVHRGFGRERGIWWKLGRDVLVLITCGAVASTVYACTAMLVHGHFNW